MDNAKQQIVDRLKQANNILVTVRNNPTVDLLSACIGLALVLDKLDKHAAAVFSGKVPSAIEFLKPEQTIEQNPDSLRDFIIALDKSKADKLRYKVEDTVVRIFITPYKTSLSQDDLEFSQGDFNVDAVVALGAHEQQELDAAITAHGRILHDATVMSINNTPSGSLGAIGWQDVSASSISEMVAELVKAIAKDALDEQISTALLTGIVAETSRFSNEKTTPKTMSLAGELMAAGANQQLVATELQEAAELPASIRTSGSATEGAGASAGAPSTTTPSKKNDDGTLEIEHTDVTANELPDSSPQSSAKPTSESAPEPVHVTPGRTMLPTPEPPITNVHGAPSFGSSFTEEYGDEEMPRVDRSYLVDEPVLPASTPKPAEPPVEPSTMNPLNVPPAEPPAPIIARSSAPAPAAVPPAVPAATSVPIVPVPPQPAVSVPQPPQPVPAAVPQHDDADDDDQTLEEIEESVHSPHTAASDQSPSQSLDTARSQVLEALKESPEKPEPIVSLNATPLSGDLHPRTAASVPLNMAVAIDEDGNLQPAPGPLSATMPPVQPAVTLPAGMSLPPMPPSVTPAAGPLGSPPPVPPPLTTNFLNPAS